MIKTGNYYEFKKRENDNYYDIINNGTYYGLANENQEIIISCNYTKPVQILSENSFYARRGNFCVIIDAGNVVLYQADAIQFHQKTRVGCSSIFDKTTHEWSSYLIDENGNILDDSWESICMNENGFYAFRDNICYELDGYGKLIGKYDTSPKVIGTIKGKYNIMFQQENPTSWPVYYGLTNQDGKYIVPLNYNHEPFMISDDRIIAHYSYGTPDSTKYVIYDTDGNVLCDQYEFMQFYTDYTAKPDDRVYSEYGIAGDLIDNWNCTYNYYLINKNGEVVRSLPYYNCCFKDMETLSVQDAEGSEWHDVKLSDLLK